MRRIARRFAWTSVLGAVALGGVVAFGGVALGACGRSDAGAASADAGDEGIDLGGDPYVDADVPDGNKPMVDGGYAAPDGEVIPADRFVTEVVSFTPGGCAGYGANKMPEVVEGPPVGGGDNAGGLDVLSLGYGGEIVLGFGDDTIVDGPGADFLVFENAFLRGSDGKPFVELGEVSVSEDDGATWKTFPCDPTPNDAGVYGTCAGWHPVLSAPGNGISPIDPSGAGGDPFDLAAVGATRVTQVRVRDMKSTACDPSTHGTNVGFDLDAIAIVNASQGNVSTADAAPADASNDGP